mgnify:FL=1
MFIKKYSYGDEVKICKRDIVFSIEDIKTFNSYFKADGNE